ncbi:family 16 glycosylhydrolase [Cellulosimicrobium cellulans]|nr:glycoside hydrolase family 16 protein [Cellulosimicrobium cellulans]
MKALPADLGEMMSLPHEPSSPSRRTLTLILAAAAGLALVAAWIVIATRSSPPTSPPTTEGGQVTTPAPNDPTAVTPESLAWSDEFDGAAGSAPNPDVWNHETGAGGWGNAELQNYTTSRVNSALDGQGNLVITALQESDGSYTSARLTTQGNVQPQFGRIEARIQIPRGQGIWSAFWMVGANLPDTPWPTSGEIDIMENVGNAPHEVHGTVHGPGYSGDNGIMGTYQHPQGWSFADDFHTFGIDWTPGEITWLVDGQEYHRVTTADVGANQWVFDQPFFLILNVAIGGQWPGNPDATTPFPQQMKVDYVRVYDNATQ